MKKLVYVLALALMVPVVAAAQSRWMVEKSLTAKGTVVEGSCYHKLGLEKVNTAAHDACAKDCVSKGQALGIMTDDDGYLEISGPMTDNKFAKLTQYIGKRVQVTGEMQRDAFSARYIELVKIAPSK